MLEGSVRVAAGQVRVNSRLIAADTGTQIWSRRYDRNLIDVFAIQDEIAAAIAAELKMTLTRQEPAKAPTIHFAAYEAVLEGRYHIYRFAPADQAASLACFEKALTIDPDYAAAHLGVALYHWGQMFAGMGHPRRCLDLSLKSVSEALRLDPGNSDGNYVLANHYALGDFDWEQAERHFDRAIELNPNSQWAYTCKGIFLLSRLCAAWKKRLRATKRRCLSTRCVCRSFPIAPWYWNACGITKRKRARLSVFIIWIPTTSPGNLTGFGSARAGAASTRLRIWPNAGRATRGVGA